MSPFFIVPYPNEIIYYVFSQYHYYICNIDLLTNIYKKIIEKSEKNVKRFIKKK